MIGISMPACNGSRSYKVLWNAPFRINGRVNIIIGWDLWLTIRLSRGTAHHNNLQTAEAWGRTRVSHATNTTHWTNVGSMFRVCWNNINKTYFHKKLIQMTQGPWVTCIIFFDKVYTIHRCLNIIPPRFFGFFLSQKAIHFRTNKIIERGTRRISIAPDCHTSHAWVPSSNPADPT